MLNKLIINYFSDSIPLYFESYLNDMDLPQNISKTFNFKVQALSKKQIDNLEYIINKITGESIFVIDLKFVPKTSLTVSLSITDSYRPIIDKKRWKSLMHITANKQNDEFSSHIEDFDLD